MNKKIFVGSIPTSYQKEEVIEYFSVYGEIQGFSIIVKKSDKDHICGILSCGEEDTTQRILSEKHILRGQILDCHIYLRGSKLKKYLTELNQRNVYVTEIPIDCTFNQLKCVFGKFGKIQNIKFLHSKRVKEKYAIVTFFDIKAAQEALRKKRIRGLGTTIKIKVFKDKKTKMKEKRGQRNEWNYTERPQAGFGIYADNKTAPKTRLSPTNRSAHKQKQTLRWFSFSQSDKVHEVFMGLKWNNPIDNNHRFGNLRINCGGLF